jgi:hypothetical protein
MNQNRWIISVPFGFETGGPEALHQLCQTLREHNQKAFVFPEKGTEKNVRVKAYEKYDAPEIQSYDSSDILVVPEVIPRLISKTRRSVLWWLSVDNSPLINDLNFKKPNQIFDRRFSNKLYSNSTFHVTQSVYAQEFLKKQANLESSMLTDWVRVPKIKINEKRPKYIAVNGNKGVDRFEVLRNYMPEFNFKVIKNLSKQDAMELLANAELYLDLGHQPGKDRLPREAALLNVPVLLLKTGAARNHLDFPLSDEYKFQWNRLDELKSKIEEMLNSRTSVIDSQYQFKKNIENEHSRFQLEVRNLIQRVTNE